MTNKTVVKSKSKLSIEVEIIIHKQDDYYVAYCPALELSAYSSTLEGAKKSFAEELNIFLEETTKRRTLNEYLLQNGWRLQRLPIPNYEPPKADLAKLFKLASAKNSILIRQQFTIPV
jgi:hypothetical protein